MFNNIYKNKKVFVTGHTGFKGGWLSLWLKSLGAEVLGYSLSPSTEPALFSVAGIDKQIKSVIGNILDVEKLEKTINDFEPDIIFHLAAQPIVRLSYSEPVNTYQTNVIGTLNILEAARKCKSVKAFVNITTDKCYENIEKDYAYKEDDKMGGYDMYSSSKACVEILSASYRNSFLKENDGNSFLLATVRAGNVVGGGDWAKDRLIPDCIRALNNNEAIVLRNPNAVRPWQHVLEPLCGYLTVGERLLNGESKFAQGYNFGPEKSSLLPVSEITKLMIKTWGSGEVKVEASNLHEANLLMLDINKAKRELNWTPKFDIAQTISKTVEWYKVYYSKSENVLDFTIKQIEEYQNAAKTLPEMV